MPQRQTVNQKTPVLLSRGVHRSGYDHTDAPDRATGMFTRTLEEFLSPTFGHRHRGKDDCYFMPGMHDSKVYRYRVNDSDFDHKDEYKFFLIPIDIDVYGHDGRTKWRDYPDSRDVIHSMWNESEFISSHASVICSSSGGIRIIFKLDKFVNSLEWRTLYDRTVKQIAKDFKGVFGKRGKMTFEVDRRTLVLDPRNPGSLTRVPYGYRSGAPVTEAKYFFDMGMDELAENVLPVDYFGKLEEYEKVKCEISGYEMVNLKLPVPLPDTIEELPEGINRFHWPDGPPKAGERELAIFQEVSKAKRYYRDNLTPEQYYAYFYDAIISEMDNTGAKIAPSVQLWHKITRDWYQRSEAETAAGKKLDITHLRNSGGEVFYPARDFDKVKSTAETFEYAARESKKVTKELLSMTKGAAFLNPPPGAGKSTSAVELLETNGGIYLAPSNKQILDLLKKISRKRINQVLSYRELIPIICSGDKEAIAILRTKYDNEYNPLYEVAQIQLFELNENLPDAIKGPLHIRRGRYWYIKSFPEYIKEFYPVQASQLTKENKKRIEKLEAGHTSVITHAKFLTICSRPGVQGIVNTHQIIFDEAEPIDVVEPEKFLDQATVTVYGVEMPPPYLPSRERQTDFVKFLKSHVAIFINADHGLERTLKHNGFEDVTTYGKKMSPILDNDLHVVLSPDLGAGFAPFRNEEDTREISPRAIYAGQVNSNIYTLMTNGCDVSGKSLTKFNNLKRVIGSNDYLNSRVISLITNPTPEQIAEISYATGIKPERAQKLIFQNLINQVISRNVGYRSHDVVNNYRISHGDKIAPHNNEHILVLPKSCQYESLNLIVKTVNVWTMKSKKIPTQVQPYLECIDELIKIRAALYNIEPGDASGVLAMAKKLDLNKKLILNMIVTDRDPMLADFEYKKWKKLDGKNVRDVIIRHETLSEVLKKCLDKLTDSLPLKDFYKSLIGETSEKYIKNQNHKDLKDFIKREVFRYNFRVVKKQRVDYLAKTDEQSLFS